MILNTNNHIRIELIQEQHSAAIFEMVDANRAHLRPWLPFVDRMQSPEFAHSFVKGTLQRNANGTEYACVIFVGHTMVGRIGIYKLDAQNKTGEIGYWLIEPYQGKGIMTQACRALMDFSFADLQLNRLEIKCGTQNHKSKGIPERLNFTHEGVLRQAEWLYDKFIDLDLYAFLKTDAGHTAQP